jgi:hypothetical protein
MMSSPIKRGYYEKQSGVNHSCVTPLRCIRGCIMDGNPGFNGHGKVSLVETVGCHSEVRLYRMKVISPMAQVYYNCTTNKKTCHITVEMRVVGQRAGFSSE